MDLGAAWVSDRLRLLVRAILLVPAALLSACGGGGGQSPAPQLQDAPPALTSPSTATVDDDTTGVVYQATATDPDGNVLTFSIAGGPDQAAFRISTAGALSFVEPANYEAPADSDHDNVYMVRLAVSDGTVTTTLDLSITVRDVPVPTEAVSAWTLAATAPWAPRDSAGEAGLGNQLFIMGGWETSFGPARRDVWSSPDGISWSEVTAQAPWTHSDVPMGIAFNGRLWMMGGYDLGRLSGATASNEIWSSADGANWTLEAIAPWSERLGAGLVVLNGRMWIIGGLDRYFDGTQQSLRNDVWSSADGRTWTAATLNAPWAPRAFFNALAWNGRIYIFGGGNYFPQFEQRNDVWSSADGAEWRRETARAEWLPRIWAAAVVYRDRMWLLGGHGRTEPNDPGTAFNLNDVWTSTDGVRWTKILSPDIWTPRHEMSAWVLNDTIVVAAGFDGSQLKSEVWTLRLP